MKRFAKLFLELDQTTKTNEKIQALTTYFGDEDIDSIDKLWALYLLSGKRPRQQVKTSLLRQWATEEAGLPPWLVDESYDVVGDLAEALSLLLPETLEERAGRSLAEWMHILFDLSAQSENEKREIITQAWRTFTHKERFVFNKLITGGFRIGVSRNLLVRALSIVYQIDTAEMTHRLMGNWSPYTTSYETLLATDLSSKHASTPYPFFLASQLEGDPSGLGDIREWQAEWKWDGIRGQLIKRSGDLHIWSRGEELISDRFPELQFLREHIPDGVVLDGEILCATQSEVLPFSVLQTRIGRKKLSDAILKSAPARFFAYDLLEIHGEDMRSLPLSNRRRELETLVGSWRAPPIMLSPVISVRGWDELATVREESRKMNAEGIMLKRLSSPYQVGRRRGDWWKWKIDPYSIDAVLVYAQPGHGRRADLFTDYTFALWQNGALVPFAKAYSGLTDQEILEVNHFIKRNTIEKFGPVRHVTPKLVFEIAFDSIQYSKRHKSGIAVRFPRILRWRKDKDVNEADTVENLERLLNVV